MSITVFSNNMTMTVFLFFVRWGLMDGYSHVKKTVQRFDSHQTILAIQDTSYISYKTHTKTR